MNQESCHRKARAGRTSLALFLVALPLVVNANGTFSAIEDEVIHGFAVCQAWGSAVFKSTARFPEEWSIATLMLQATGIANVMTDESPFQRDSRFQKVLRATSASLASEPASPESPAYKQAHATCMAHVESLGKQRR